MNKVITEGKARIKVEKPKVVSKDMEVFYNPIMKHNRDISVLLLNSIDINEIRVGLPLSGSGVRGVRFLLELSKKKIKEIWFNDYSSDAVKSIKKNLRLNKASVKDGRITIKNDDANLFLLNTCGFDYIDIDPFGSPNMFLDSAVKRISRNGILAVTATDTAALAGTYPKACKRKYWGTPIRDENMHETGLRILIKKCQLIGAQFDKALIPVFSYFKDHYFRVFFRCVKGKKEVDKVIKQHDFFNVAGPLWTGDLWDKKLVNFMNKNLKKGNFLKEDKELSRFLGIIKDESKIGTVGFFDIHSIVKKEKLKVIPRKEELISNIRKKGFKATETHFSGTGIRSDISYKELIRMIKK